MFAHAKIAENRRLIKLDEETYLVKPTLSGKYPCTKCDRTGKIITRIVMEGNVKVSCYNICDKFDCIGSNDYQISKIKK